MGPKVGPAGAAQKKSTKEFAICISPIHAQLYNIQPNTKFMFRTIFASIFGKSSMAAIILKYDFNTHIYTRGI